MAACDEKKPYIFISYSHKDADKVLTVLNRLQAIFINKYNADCIEEAYRRLFTASGIEVTKVYKSETINTNIKAFSEAFETKDEPADKMSGSKVDKNNSKKKSEKFTKIIMQS